MNDLISGQQLALDTILRKPVQGIGIWLINPMEWRMIDRLAGLPEGSYKANPVPVYRRMLEKSGCCMVDQWIPTNPLSMGPGGFDSHQAGQTATTGAQTIVCDGITIDSPEAVVEHMEKIVSPTIAAQIIASDEPALIERILAGERQAQGEIGPNMLKVPYTAPFARFPGFRYGDYGYENYFMAYALYPDVMEKLFALEADLALKHNRAAARAITSAGLPPMIRLDHDMADSRGTLVDIRSLDRLWFPHFARCIQPFLDAGITLIWHCDGNLMQMVPRLLEVGIGGFQGFQYEDGMDYEAICKMKTREGDDLLIIAGVSVTRTLPYGTPSDISEAMRWLVKHGPRRGLFLGGSSSIAPGVPWENLRALVEGFHHYRTHGRSAEEVTLVR